MAKYIDLGEDTVKGVIYLTFYEILKTSQLAASLSASQERLISIFIS